MKQIKEESEVCGKMNQVSPPRPPPPPPLPRFWIRKTASLSITNKEIAKFWRQKRINEEEHLFAAIKAAARIRARNLSEEDYKHFEESLKENSDDNMEQGIISSNDIKKDDKKKHEVRLGIKDWWTKSKYAYLNQPALGSRVSHKRRASTYTPNCFFQTYRSSVPYVT